MKKFELTAECKVECGIKLFRIRALKAIAKFSVKIGDLGGWVEKEENQEWFEQRLVDCPIWNYASKIWLSCEPLLGSIDLRLMYPRLYGLINWVVVGCESGPKRRPCNIEWVESIVEQCRAAEVPVFVKQLDLNGKCVTDINKFPKHLQIRQVPWATTKEGAE